jgi:ABC-type multidrug transport system fused ATPase/permease subunit
MLSRQPSDLLVTYLRPQRARVVVLGVLLPAGMLLELLNPQVIRFFLDTASSGGPQAALLAAAAVFIAASLGQRGIGLISRYLSEAVGWSATNALRRDLAQHCLQLDLAFHKEHSPGELIERIDGDVTALAHFFSAFVARVLSNALLVVGILIVLHRENAVVGIALTLYTLTTLLVLRAIQPAAVAAWTGSRAAEAELYGFIEERISGAEEIRAAGAETYTLHRLYALMRRGLERFRASAMVDTAIYNITSLSSVLGYAAGLAAGAYLYTSGQATIGAAFMVVAYVGMLAGPLQSLRGELQEFQHALASIGRVLELMQTRPRIAVAGSVADAAYGLDAGPLSTVFEGVTFGYVDGGQTTGQGEGVDHDLAPMAGDGSAPAAGRPAPAVLSDISFHVQAGRVLGLLGRSGSGKTTLARLLFRLYDVDAGAIRLGGTDIRAVPLADLRSRVAWVTQDVQLFQATVRDNLTFFDRRIDDDAVEAALRGLRLWEWVSSLPQGLNTPLASGSAGISGGEAQLLAFARAFLKDPGLVILDEASSRLDPATETLLESAIDRLLQGRTGIVIAHRLRTVQRADDILILEAGRVVEYGPRERLAADPNSRFSRLLRTGLEEVLA